MSKKSGGLFTLLTGMVAGAAAVFFSEKENRIKTKKVAKRAVTAAKKVKADYKKDPIKTKAELKSEIKRVVKKAIKKSSNKPKKVNKTPKK